MNVYTFVLKMCVILKQSDTGHKKQKKRIHSNIEVKFIFKQRPGVTRNFNKFE